MMARIFQDTKPTIMAAASAASVGANIAVWLDYIKGAAAVATAITAFLILLYWGIKVSKAWKFRNQKDND